MRHKWRYPSVFGRTLLAVLCATTLLTSCSKSDETAFCNASKEFNSLVADINVSDIASSLGPDFWNSLATSVDDLKNSSPKLLSSEIDNLDSDLDGFIEQLELNDYNLLLMILDPDTLATFTHLIEGVLSKISTELSKFQSANC